MNFSFFRVVVAVVGSSRDCIFFGIFFFFSSFGAQVVGVVIQVVPASPVPVPAPTTTAVPLSAIAIAYSIVVARQVISSQRVFYIVFENSYISWVRTEKENDSYATSNC